MNQFLLLILLFCSINLFAEKKRFKVGVEAIYFLPYSNFKDNNYSGIFKKKLDAFASKYNYQFEYIALPLERLYTDFLNQNIDFKIPANKYWQEEKKKKFKENIIYSDAVIDFTDGIMVRAKDKNLSKNQLKTIGIISGFTPWDYIDDIKNNTIKLRENPDLEGLFKQVMLGRVNGVYTNISVANHFLKHEMNKEGALVFAKQLPHTTSHYHLATIKHPNIIKKFNEFLKSSK